MKFLLTSFLGLSAFGGGFLPVTLTNLNDTNIKSGEDTQVSKTISLGENVVLETVNSEKEYSIKFNWESTLSIHQVDFHNGGLRSYTQWGDEYWDYSWKTLDLKTDGQTYEITRINRNSGLAKAQTLLMYTLTKVNQSEYEFKIYVSNDAWNSFSKAYGTLTIGDQLTFRS